MVINKLSKLQKYSGLAGVVIIWLGVGLAMFIGKLSLFSALPVSSLGVNPKTSVLFSLSLLISSGLFISFAYYIRSTYMIRNKFLTLFLVGQFGQIIVAIAPYGADSRYKLIHTIAAFILAFSLPYLIHQFYRSQALSTYRGLYRNLMLIEILLFIIGIGAFVFTKGIAPLGEILPTMGFHLWIIVTSIIAFKHLESDNVW
jgi:hypothetical protein